MLTRPELGAWEGDHRWPEFLPGGEACSSRSRPAPAASEHDIVGCLDLRTVRSKVLTRGGRHAPMRAGLWSYGISGTLRASPSPPTFGRCSLLRTRAGRVATRYGAANAAVAPLARWFTSPLRQGKRRRCR